VEEKTKEKAEKGIDSVATFGKNLLSADGIKKIAAWYIDTNEKAANRVLEYQAKAAEWAKSTPLAPIFEAQYDLSEKMVKRSAEVARKLWQIEA